MKLTFVCRNNGALNNFDHFWRKVDLKNILWNCIIIQVTNPLVLGAGQWVAQARWRWLAGVRVACCHLPCLSRSTVTSVSTLTTSESFHLGSSPLPDSCCVEDWKGKTWGTTTASASPMTLVRTSLSRFFRSNQGSRWSREANPQTPSFKAAYVVAEGRAFILGGSGDDEVGFSKTLTKAFLFPSQVPLTNVYSYHSERKWWSEVSWCGNLHIILQMFKCANIVRSVTGATTNQRTRRCLCSCPCWQGLHHRWRS